MAVSLKPQQARKLALLAQGVHRPRQFGRGLPATRRAIEHLGYIQIDTIAVVERAHHHTMWSRVNNYQLSHLDRLQRDKCIFEYWSHAAAYLPMRDYRFSLPRKHAIASGDKHWYDKDPKLAKQVLQRIEREGPLQSRDFEHVRRGANQWWEWKPAKRALEQLFMEGALMISHREGFQKVYDLTERVLPPNIDTTLPSEEEHHDHLINSYLRAHGLGNATQMGYLLKGQRARLQQRCIDLTEDGQLLEVEVNGESFFVLPDFEQLLAKPLSRNRVAILSPFDNLVIQRKRAVALFGFDYQIECYVPAAKRRYGYFCLPLLWGHRFAGRMDAKIDRSSGVLHVLSLHLEEGIDAREFKAALQPALDEFIKFNQGDRVKFPA
ncbi:MAG: winged helix-turn-helix domain-containing protein [Gammaproteobacteria bacterium]|nr:winged helix-turn-helix domain-containing protein [Gammaproteobacteria bacterium]